MNKLEKHYNRLKAFGASLCAIEKVAKGDLIEFVKEYGVLYINIDGVPHTVTDLSTDEPVQYQIESITVENDKLVVGTTTGEILREYFAFDDITYLIDDLSDECLEYAKDTE